MKANFDYYMPSVDYMKLTVDEFVLKYQHLMRIREEEAKNNQL